MADNNMNIFQNFGFRVGTGNGNQEVQVTGKNIQKAFENIFAAPIADFFTNSQEEEKEILDYPEAIDAAMTQYAKMENLLGGEQHKINIVF